MKELRPALTSKLGKRSLLLALLAAVAVVLSAASLAQALGELSQKPGTAGCISEDGTAGNPKTEPPTICQDGKALEEAFSVAVSPDGRNVYVASLADSVAIFDRDPATGALSQKEGTAGCISEDGSNGACQDGKAIREAAGIAVSPDGKSVYVTAARSNSVAIFERDPATGELKQKEGMDGCISADGTAGPGGAAGECRQGKALLGATKIAVSPAGDNVYVTAQGSKAVAIFNRNAETGALDQKAGTAGCVSEDGSGNTCQDGTALTEPFAIAVSPDGGNVYATSLGQDQAVVSFDRDPEGALFEKGGTDACISEAGGACQKGLALDGPFALAVSPDGRNVYIASNFEAVAILDRAENGVLTQPPGAPGCVSQEGKGGCQPGVALRSPFGVAVSPDGESVYVSSSIGGSLAVLDRNATTGELKQKAGIAGCFTESARLCQKAIAINNAAGVIVSPDGKNVYMTAQGSRAISIFDRPTPAPAPVPSAEATRPAVSGFRLSPARFRPKPKGGSSFRFSLSEQAVVQIAIERARPGRLVGRTCRPATPNLTGHHSCRRFTPRASLEYANRAPGKTTIRFSGRISGHALTPGAYRATIVASNVAGNRSAPERTNFTVLSARRQANPARRSP